MEEYGYITLRSVVIKIISLIMMLIFVRNRESYIIYAFIHCVATAGNNIFNCINIRKYVKLSLNNIDCLIHIKSVIILLFTQISVELYTKVDTTMIGFINGDENVGYYANSMKLIKLIVSVLTALGAILLPRLSKYYNENRNVEFDMMVNKALKVIFVLCIPCMSGVYLLSDNIILLIFGKSFLPAITTMRILSILIPIYSVGNLYGSQLLMILGQEKKLMYSVMIGTVVNVILNSFFIVIWKQNGAAFASLITELCVLIAQINFVKSYIKWDSFKRLINTTIISDIGMMIAIIIIKCFINSDILQILFSVVIGSITYFLINMLLKNEAIIEIKKVILNKILIISERKRYI
jgi:O-antigen/teichoic acid export membrane protein